jgi:(R,R)-butanediol dehydrogenase/meso-butanediol dehydrogenase/diacetyl reductase
VVDSLHRVRAAFFTGQQSLVVEEREAAPPGVGEVQIEVAYAGICGTDLHILHGAMADRVPLPAVLGHESSGRLSALGSEVDGWRVGDPVAVMPLRWCGECAACRAGYTHVCQRLKVIGVDLPGAMQGLWNVPADTLVALPPELALDQAALVEPTAVAVHDVRTAAVQPGEKVVIVGGGPIGLLIGCVVRAEGGEPVVVELDPHRREVAARIGLPTVDPKASDVNAYVDDWTSGAGAPVSFEVSGAAAGMRTATDVLAVRGRCVVVAIHTEAKPVDLNRVFLRELRLLGARVYQRSDFEHAVSLVGAGTVPAGELISRIVPIAQAGEAFDALQAGGGVVKVLVDCQAA